MSIPLLLLLVLCGLLPPQTVEARTKVVDGLMDLRGQDLSTPIALQGDWNFYWEKILTPNQLPAFENEKIPITVPGSWYQDPRHSFSKFGSGTYHLKFKLERIQELVISIPTVWSAAQVFIDGKDIGSFGKVNLDPNAYQPANVKIFKAFTPQSTTFDLVIQASNYDIFLSGITSIPTVGTAEAMIRLRDRQLCIEFFVIGALFIMGIYHLCLFGLRKEDPSTLCFALLCFCVMSYSLSGGIVGLEIFWESITYERRLFIFNFSWMAATHAFIWFAYNLYQPNFKLRVAQLGSLIAGLHHVTTLLFPAKVFVTASVVFQFFVIPILAYSCWVAWQADHRKPFLWGILFLVVAVINDMLSIRLIVNTPLIGGFGVFVFTVVQSYLLANRFYSAFVNLKQSERMNRLLSEDLKTERDTVLALNENLELIVDRKTRETRSIMEHIPLGIFMIVGSQRQIARDYSSHLKKIFYQDDLAEKNALEHLFLQTELTEDEKSQAESAISASLDELDINFEMNSSLLPLEIRRFDTQGIRRNYDLTWSPVVNNQNITERILVTIRDVTELKGLRYMAEQHEQELEIIDEILQVSPSKFNRFMSNSFKFLAENQNILQALKPGKHDVGLLRIIFINTHTIKGAARSLYLTKITAMLHEAEQYYALLREDPSRVWELDRLQREMQKIVNMLQLYEQIAREKLGRNPEQIKQFHFSIGGVQQNFITLMEIAKYRDLPSEWLAPLLSMSKELFDHIHMKLRPIIEESFQVLPSLAKALHKNLLQLSLLDGGLLATAESEELLQRILVHLLNNSMDHGIESPKERLTQGKPSVPTISIRFLLVGDIVTLEYGDDGRGLNLDGIREQAFLRNLIQPTDSVHPEQLAALLLEEGFSTKNQVSEISGRGIGMSSIRKFIQNVGGDVEIKLLKNQQIDQHFYPFSFEIHLPASLFAQAWQEGLERAA